MKKYFFWSAGLVFLFFTVLVILGGSYYYHFQKSKIIDNKQKELQAIVNLKIDEIAQWGNERIADGSLFADNQFLIEEIGAFFRNNRSGERNKLVGYLRSFLENKNYHSILLIDRGYNLRAAYPVQDSLMGDYLNETIREPDSRKHIRMTDLHSSDVFQGRHLDMIVPLYRIHNSDSIFTGFVVLRIDPKTVLYPVINSWPVPSSESEVIVLREEGDSLIFFNNPALRNIPGGKINLSDTVKYKLCKLAVSGFTGATEGTDYRNVPVIAYISKIRNSPWSIIGKTDMNEIEPAILYNRKIMLAFTILLILAAAGFLAYIWRTYSARLLKRQLESEKRYRSTLDNMIEGCQLIGYDWRYIYINDSAEKHNRVAKEQLLGKKYMDCWPGIENSEVFGKLKLCMEEGTPSSLLNMFRFPDGYVGWFNLNILPSDEGMLIFSSDVTLTIQTRKYNELRQKILSLINSYSDTAKMIDEVLASIRESTGVEAAAIRLREGADFPYLATSGFDEEFVQQEKYLCNYDESGNPKTDGKGDPLLECMCGNILCGRVDPSKSFFTDGGSFRSVNTTHLLETTAPEDRMSRTRNMCNSSGYESVALIPIRSGDSTIGLLQLNDHRINFFDDEIVPFFEGLCSNIGLALERDKAMKDIKTSEEKFRNIFELSPLGKSMTDVDGTIHVNTSFCKMLGYTENDFKKITWREITHPDDIEKTEKVIEDLVSGKSNEIRFEKRYINKNGNIVFTEVSTFLHKDTSGTPDFFITTVNDITERIKAEAEIIKLNEELEKRVHERTQQLLEANKELESFSYSVSHDLRAPLRAIHSFTSILKEDFDNVLDDEGKRICGIIESASVHMGNLIDDLLAFSRVGRSEMLFSMADMGKMVRSAIDEILNQNGNPNISFREGNLHSVQGDINTLRLVWTNLISNAVKYSSKKEHPEIEIGSIKENGFVTYYVKDNGAGFDMKYYNKLFGVFQRLHSQKEFEGNGVGLAIVQRIVARHGGRVWAESEAGKGAVFYFSLPVTNESGASDQERLSV